MSKLQNDYLKLQKGVDVEKKDMLELENVIKKNENALTSLNNELSLKLSEREKIRHDNLESEME